MKRRMRALTWLNEKVWILLMAMWTHEHNYVYWEQDQQATQAIA